jgi:hypothetical protein
MDEKSPHPRQRVDARVEQAHRMFNRVLVSWASDILELRRRNLLVPDWAWAKSARHTASCEASQGGKRVLPMNDAA